MPEEIIEELLALDEALGLRDYYSERSVFYNPNHLAPLGVIFASFKDHDGPNDKASDLARPGVYRFAFQMPAEDYERRFGPSPARPPKGGVVALDMDLTQLDVVLPHPVYAWMRWVQILSPSPESFAAVRSSLNASLESARVKWRSRQR